MIKIEVVLAQCTGCEKCVAACPVRAIVMEAEKAVIDKDRCTLCTTCVAECETGAIRILTPQGAIGRNSSGALMTGL